MRLLERKDTGEVCLIEVPPGQDAPPYAILSHTWGEEEVTFKDFMDGTTKNKLGYQKIRFCGEQVSRDNLGYFWIDTCCIDKSSSAELQEAINSMFRWYRDAVKCYVYLSDVSRPADDHQAGPAWESAFRKSRWFTRGWTLQELIAPAMVQFFSREGVILGDKSSLESHIHDVTEIPVEALRGRPLYSFSVPGRLEWAEDRETTRKEDKAYSLLGIFNVHMPLIYGEGRKKAFKRLREVISKAADDDPSPMLATNSAVFDSCAEQYTSHWIVPFDRNRDFIGRSEILAKLLKKIPPDAEEDACQRIAIEGLGGVGKTQIALEAAFHIRKEQKNCSVFWVPALNSTVFESAYREIGRQLKIQGVEDDKADAKLLLKTALSQSSFSWVLIIDNADDTDLVSRSGATTPLFDYLPSSHKGSILFTTRNHEVTSKLGISRADTVRVNALSRPEANEMLQQSLDPSRLGDCESTSQLLDFLADLPLAIRQASAYIDQTEITVARYLSYCQSSDKRFTELLSKDFTDRGRYDAVQNPIATTWLISFRHVSRDKPLAARYLQFMSFLSEKNIPKDLLPPADSELEVDEALAVLKAYAFISERPGQGAYDMHRLVRLAMQNCLSAEGRLKECLTMAVQRLDDAFPWPDYDNKAIWEKYLPHAQRVAEYQDGSLNDMAYQRLLWNVAESYLKLGNYPVAEELYRLTLEMYVKTLGPEHPDTLFVQHNLANTLGCRGKYTDAKELFQTVLAARIKTLGAEHPGTLSTKNSLAELLRATGRYVEAEELFQAVLAARIKTLGAEHPNTLSTKNSLAEVLYAMGRDVEAEELFQAVLAASIKTLGAEHPDTLRTKNSLAEVLRATGRYVEAEELFQAVLAASIKTLGAEHPDTLITKNSLANMLRATGRYVEAEELFQAVLAASIKTLGAEHPNTLITKNSLANMFRATGRYVEAEEL